MQNINWESLFQIWKQRLIDKRGVLPSFKIQHRQAALVEHELWLWYPSHQIDSFIQDYDSLQRKAEFGHAHHKLERLHSSYTNKGLTTTCHILDILDGDIEPVCALLILSSVYVRGYAKKTQRPRCWPSHGEVNQIYSLALSELSKHIHLTEIPWHELSSRVLPILNKDVDYSDHKLSLTRLVQLIADEHLQIFDRFTPFKLSASSLSHKEINEIEHIRQNNIKKLEVMMNCRMRAPSKPEPTSKPTLFNISNEDLLHRIWSKPTQEVAKDLGVSDSAISKRCRRDGIPKPEKGFWNKVKAGKIKHPNGEPQN